jgi:hypothetical protein
VLFYVLPQEITVGILDRMARFDYPGGFGALRFIEDDPPARCAPSARRSIPTCWAA